MHRDLSPFVLPCGAILNYFCTNVVITFKKIHYRSVLCNLYYFYWNMRDLNQVDHDLGFTEPGTTSLGSDISIESLEMSSVSETFFFL